MLKLPLCTLLLTKRRLIDYITPHFGSDMPAMHLVQQLVWLLSTSICLTHICLHLQEKPERHLA